MNEFHRTYYLEAILSLRRSMNTGSPNLAKPILLLSIVNSIKDGITKRNVILFEKILPMYEGYKKKANDIVARMSYPFYFLASDGFYHLKWRGEPKKHTSPSAKFIRDNIEYAYLDAELWELLQDEEVRQEYSQAIRKRYLDKTVRLWQRDIQTL